MAEQEFDPERGRAAAEKLRALGVQGVLVGAAEQGRITQVVCKMPECYCPEEIGGACYFEPRGTPLTDWMPTADHFPKLKTKGRPPDRRQRPPRPPTLQPGHYSKQPAAPTPKT